jgi:cytochrome c peroxidase
MVRTAIAAAGILVLLVGACDRPTAEDAELSEKNLAEVYALSPLPETPASPTNAFADHPGAAAFGQRLFYDKRLSANGKISCATCHDPAHGFSDGKPLSEGLQTTPRHSNALWNVGHQRWFFWDGRADSLWSQSLQPLQSELEMGATPAHALGVVADDESLQAAYEELFGPLPAAPSPNAETLNRFLANLGKSFEAYERLLISTDAPFDQFVEKLRVGEAPERAGFNEVERRGLKLFVGRGNCILCHAGPNFSDGEFHNIGLTKHPDLRKDSGRFEGVRLVKEDVFNGFGEFSDDRSPETNIKLRYLVVKMNNLAEFKTPSLRHIAETAPYMHDGRFATLREVLDHYSDLPDDPPLGHREESLVPLDLSEREKDELEAFLKTLTGKSLESSLLQAPASVE